MSFDYNVYFSSLNTQVQGSTRSALNDTTSQFGAGIRTSGQPLLTLTTTGLPLNAGLSINDATALTTQPAPTQLDSSLSNIAGITIQTSLPYISTQTLSQYLLSNLSSIEGLVIQQVEACIAAKLAGLITLAQKSPLLEILAGYQLLAALIKKGISLDLDNLINIHLGVNLNTKILNQQLAQLRMVILQTIRAMCPSASPTATRNYFKNLEFKGKVIEQTTASVMKSLEQYATKQTLSVSVHGWVDFV